MNRIRLLPEQVANQIAAGEVIERPASVVKELVENSLDAQSTRITVEIQAGGRSLVRIADDGTGMSRDDALLCLERHATSKIQAAEDLAAITTMGFRGEALPSIASVSRFTLTTRERDSSSPEGTQLALAGGRLLDVKAAGSAPGTTVEVRQLFYNLPARRKFLRSEETESAHIQHYLTLAALAYPEVAFTFLKDGRVIWQLPAIKSGLDMHSRLASLRERLRALYGSEQKLLQVDFCASLDQSRDRQGASRAGEDYQLAHFDAETDNTVAKSPLAPLASEAMAKEAHPSPLFRLWGFIGAPGVSRSTRQDQHVFVNRRPVENRGLNFALLEGYHTSLMKGRYPVCCLFLEIDPADVDVNIHPAKREVKFHQEAQVRRLVAEAVRQTLLGFHRPSAEVQSSKSKVQSLPSTSKNSQIEPLITAESQVQKGQVSLPNFPAALSPPADIPSPISQSPLPMGFASGKMPETLEASPAPDPTQSSQLTPTTTAPASANPQSAIPNPQSGPVPLLHVPLRLVGVIGRLYVVLESDRGLVLLDQHAAHERILFEQMLDRLERNDQAPCQKLLLPETVELSARDATFLREQLPALTRLGVGLSEFGDRTFLLDGLPPFVKATEPRRFVLELIDQLKAAGQEVNSSRLGEHTVAKTVCRHAVKANDPLGGPELESLVADLRRCAMPYTCPHGRPTIIEMNFRELEKKFGRTQ